MIPPQCPNCGTRRIRPLRSSRLPEEIRTGDRQPLLALGMRIIIGFAAWSISLLVLTVLFGDENPRIMLGILSLPVPVVLLWGLGYLTRNQVLSASAQQVECLLCGLRWSRTEGKLPEKARVRL